MKRIDTVAAREKLPARATAYWMPLERGLALGFRKLAPGSTGTWLSKIRDSATGKVTWRSLGTFEDLPGHERYGAAKKAAEALAGHLERGGTADSMTVSELCAAYIKHQRAEGKGRSIDEAQQWVKKWIDGESIGTVDVRKLTAHHLRAWRQKLAATDVVINPHADPEAQRTRKRTPSTINRQQTILRAALNHGLEGGVVATDMAWRVALKPIPNADKRRTGYLDKAQRAQMIQRADALSADVGAFVRGLALLPLRPGALAALKVGDFDRRLSTLTIGKDKAGQGRGIKVPPSTAAFISELCKDKLPSAHIFTNDGRPWNKDSWKVPIKEAAITAGLPVSTCAYALRHSTITDLITDGLDVLTVARLSGTSVLMIERSYGHLRAEHGAAALAKLAV